MNSINILLIIILIVSNSCNATLNVPKDKKEFTLPQKFGNYSLSSLSSAPPCGEGLASYNDIVAYSNGDYQGTGDSCSGWSSTGLQYQCVEYAQRYFNSLYGIAPVWPVDYAYQMCSNYPGGITPVGSPGVGLGVVFNWPPYGHVAVVIGVNDGTIDVIEQNGSPTGTNTYYQSEVLCYLSP
jgi:hypothetical protein